MTTRAVSFDDTFLPSTVERGLVFGAVWDSGKIGYHLERGDADDNGSNDWDENGARAAMALTFDLWAEVADLDFFPTSRFGATLIETTYSEEPDEETGLLTLGRHFLPGGNSEGSGLRRGEQSDGEYNVESRGWSASGLTQGGSGFATMIHEIGHALGLEHPFDDDLFLGSSGESFGDLGYFGLNQGAYTVMTYDGGWIGNGGESRAVGYGHSGTPMALDIAAVQTIYGANMDHATGDDTYTLSDVNGAGTFYSAVWDAGGTDTFAYDGTKDANLFLDEATIDDSPTGGGLLSYIDGVFGGMTVARGTVIENARTGAGDDVIGGNAADNTLEAGAGDDIVFGLDGADVILGGAGDDVLVGDYRSVEAFGVALTPDLPPYDGPSLPDGLTTGDGLIRIESRDRNTSTASAVDISGDFLLRERSNIEQGEALYSETVTARSGGGFAYYELALAEEGRITIDIDGGFSLDSEGQQTLTSMDSWVQILDRAGAIVVENDDLVAGDVGSQSTDRGRNIDSYIDVVLDPGTYYVKVGAYAQGGPAPLSFGDTYSMHVIADAYAFTVTPPSLPAEAGFAQFGYYYETPDFSDVIGGFNRGGTGSASAARTTDKEAGPGHWHRAEDGGRVWHEDGHGHGVEGHDEGCACGGCAGGDASGPAGADEAAALPGMMSASDGRLGPEAPVFDGFVLALEGGWDVA